LILWCPSDGTISRTFNYGDLGYGEGLNYKVKFTSYAGCTGTWMGESLLYDDCLVYTPSGMDSSAHFVQMVNNMNGIDRYSYSTPIAAITDGTSNTLIYGERASDLFQGDDRNNWDWWGDAVTADTLFNTLYPIIPFRKVPNVPE
jgi:hypothetical protein